MTWRMKERSVIAFHTIFDNLPNATIYFSAANFCFFFIDLKHKLPLNFFLLDFAATPNLTS